MAEPLSGFGLCRFEPRSLISLFSPYVLAPNCPPPRLLLFFTPVAPRLLIDSLPHLLDRSDLVEPKHELKAFFLFEFVVSEHFLPFG